ncbi:MAG: hybrid sensor histidine kinase/response regulator [Candidatus Binatia bacterium]
MPICSRLDSKTDDYLIDVMTELREFPQVQAGTSDVVEDSFSLPALLWEVCSLMEGLASQKGLLFALKYDGVLPDMVESDRSCLRQILVNLLSNAIKFTDRGSVELIAQYLPNESQLQLVVGDSGVGLSRNQRDRLFQPIGNATAQPGSGLGLAMTKRLLDKLSASIVVESLPHVGSNFRVRIPIRVIEDRRFQPRASDPINIARGAAETVQGSNSGATEKRQTSGRILLVDDSVIALEATRRLLEMTGYQVHTASSGAAALKAAADFQPELLLLDISLPDISGYEVLKQLKAMKLPGNIFCIALTGYGEDERARAQQAGFDDFVMKPFDLETFDRLMAKKRKAGG